MVFAIVIQVSNFWNIYKPQIITTSGENQENRRYTGDSLRQPVMRSDLYSMCALHEKRSTKMSLRTV